MIKTGTDWIEFVTEHIEFLENKILRNQERLDSLRIDMITTAGLNYDANKVQTSVNGDKISEKCDAISEIDRQIKHDCQELSNFKDRNAKEIHRLVPNETLAVCLEMRHIQKKNVSQIACKLGLSEICIKKRFAKAYNLLNSIYILEKYRKFDEKVDNIPQKVVL